MIDSSGLVVLPTHGQSELVNSSFTVFVRVVVAVKRHHGHSNTHRRKNYLELACTLEVESLIIMVGGNGSMQTNIVLQKELRVPHLNKQVT